MPEYIRVTDDVKPRREYSIPEAAFNDEVHKRVKDGQGASPDGSPLPPKYTPESLAGPSGQKATTTEEK